MLVSWEVGPPRSPVQGIAGNSLANSSFEIFSRKGMFASFAWASRLFLEITVLAHTFCIAWCISSLGHGFWHPERRMRGRMKIRLIGSALVSMIGTMAFLFFDDFVGIDECFNREVVFGVEVIGGAHDCLWPENAYVGVVFVFLWSFVVDCY